MFGTITSIKFKTYLHQTKNFKVNNKLKKYLKQI